MEEIFINLIKDYGYIILFIWGMLEGEMGLIMAGLLSHTGDMNLYIAIFVAGLGGFCGDQVYFYTGRYGKNIKYVKKFFKKQQRKFALARVLIEKHGWPIIFVQRYMYGLRTIIPMAIAMTGFSAKKFGIINLISAFCWAAITIVPTYIFGKEILELLKYVKEYWYVVVILAIMFLSLVGFYFKKKTDKKPKNHN